VSLEDAFWQGLKEIAAVQDMTLSEMVASIDGGRKGGNLSSAIRLFVLDYYRNTPRLDRLAESASALPAAAAGRRPKRAGAMPAPSAIAARPATSASGLTAATSAGKPGSPTRRPWPLPRRQVSLSPPHPLRRASWRRPPRRHALSPPLPRRLQLPGFVVDRTQ